MNCSDCGSDQVMAFWPGQDGATSDLFRLTASYPDKAWCAVCWLKRYGFQPAPPRSGGRAKTEPLTKKC